MSNSITPLEKVRAIYGTQKRLHNVMEWLREDEVIEVIEYCLSIGTSNIDIVRVLNDKEIFPNRAFDVDVNALFRVIRETPRLQSIKYQTIRKNDELPN